MRNRIDMDFIVSSLDKMIERTHVRRRAVHRSSPGLMNFARLDEAELKEVDLDGRGQVRTVRRRWLQGRSVAWVRTEARTFTSLLCYPGKVNQVVLNLVANAIDASTRGTTVTVEHRARRRCSKSMWLTGHGNFDPTVPDGFFDPFLTTKAVGKGTGLGLSMGYSIVGAHGGRIRSMRHLEKASHFTVWLPFQSPLARFVSPVFIPQVSERYHKSARDRTKNWKLCLPSCSPSSAAPAGSSVRAARPRFAFMSRHKATMSLVGSNLTARRGPGRRAARHKSAA